MRLFAFVSPLRLVLMITLLALSGWLVNHDLLASWVPGIAKMTFNTALCFLLLALSGVVIERGGNRALAIWFAVAVGLFALLSLLQDLLGISLGIDNLLFDTRAHGGGGSYPGRMSPNTAVGFLLSSVIMLALTAWDYWREHEVMIHFLLLLQALIGILGIGMNLILTDDVPENYQHFSSISLFTAISFLLVALFLMKLFREKRGIVGQTVWLESAVQLMYRLKYPQKFALISVVFLLPIVVLMTDEVSDRSNEVRMSKLEQEGIAHLRLTSKLMRAFAEHRGMSNASGVDSRLFQDAMRKKMVQIDRLLAENRMMDQQQSKEILIPRDWEKIRTYWESIKQENLDRETRWRLHTEIIAALINHVRDIGEETGLARDSDVVLHNLLGTQLMIMPHLFESIGQMRGLGVSFIAGQQRTSSDTVNFGEVLGRSRSLLVDLERELRTPLAAGKMNNVVWLLDDFVTRVNVFDRMAEALFVGDQAKNISPEYYFEQATRVIALGDRLNEALLHHVDAQLQQRIHTQITVQYNIKLVAMLLIVVLLLLFSAFYKSVIYTIEALEQSAEKMRRGEMEGAMSLPSHDELGMVVHSFNTIASELIRVSSRLKAVIDHAVNGIVIIDASGNINTFNPAAETMFGYCAQEVIGKNITALMPEHFRRKHEQGLAQYVATGRATIVDHTIHVEGLRKEGGVFPMELLITLMEHEGQQWFVGMLRDISEQQALEEQMRHAQKMEAVGALVGGVAHNFNNMLAGIVGKAYLAKRKVKDNPQVVQRLEEIEEVTRQAGDMVKQLLTFAQKDFMREMREVALAPLVDEVVAAVRETVPETVTVSLCNGDPEMMLCCDSAQIQQMLRNLLDNAVEAVEGVEQAEIVVAVEPFVPDSDFIHRHPELKQSARYLCLSVCDNGCGIDEAVLPRIFEPFFTTKDVGEGAGLGLSSAFGTVATHEGVIEVESKVGKGSQFRVYLPMVE